MRQLARRELAAGLLLCLSLVACSGQSAGGTQGADSFDPPAANQEAVSQSVGTGGELIPIASDNVRMAGYDDASGVMTVMFDEGSVYEYYGVPPRLWLEFIAAQPHPWSGVGYPQLVQGGYPYQKVRG